VSTEGSGRVIAMDFSARLGCSCEVWRLYSQRTNMELAGVQIVRSAKVRAAEALTLRSLLNKVKPPDPATTPPPRPTP
jgi:hypothetical protein